MRRKWRIEKRLEAGSILDMARQVAEAVHTPPATPDAPPAPPIVSHQKKAGRRKVQRENKRAYRTIKRQQDKIKELQKRVGCGNDKPR